MRLHKQFVSLAFLIPSVSSLHQTNPNDELDAALLKGIMPTAGNKCKSNYDDNAVTTTSQNTFIHQSSPSYWDPMAAPFEKDLFLVEMSHNNTLNDKQSWTLRIGKSGSVYSFRGAYGEAIPPQHHGQGVFIDEVIQSVSVNLAKNQANDYKDPYYIHQAGIYTKDSPYTTNPFFSPNVVKHCNGDVECAVGSWGQHAHVQTSHKSDILYFNSYRDCGEGVIEFTTVVHNAATEGGDPVSYLNVPWGGVRRSNLRDVFLSNKDTGSLEHKYPMPSFFDEDIPNFDSTGGFTTFTEQVKASDEAFNERPPFQMPVVDRVSLKLVVANGGFRVDATKSAQWNRSCFWVSLETTILVKYGCQFCSLWFTNKRTGYKFYVPEVIHWAWNSNMMIFCSPERDLEDRDSTVAADVTKLNKEINIGDEIEVSHANVGKPVEENTALTHVHGMEMRQSDIPNGVRWASTRVRYGWAGDARRDYTVWTANARLWVNPGDTYVYRQYIVTGELTGMEARSSSWVNETYHDIFPLGEMTGGVDIHLYSNDNDSFGAYVEGGSNCLQGVSRCVGKSAPEFGMRPLYAVTCGDKKYVGSDQYIFSPRREYEMETIRSYACEGETVDIRPEWKLFGFFEEGSCQFLESAAYDSEFCSTALPTTRPSMSPSIIFSLSPSSSPAGVPTSEPSQLPSSNPSKAASIQPSEYSSFFPSVYPSLQPSMVSTSSPSGTLTFEPSEFPALQPTKSPSFEPSYTATSNPSYLSSSFPSLLSSIPSNVPSNISSQLPSSAPSFFVKNISSAFPSLFSSINITDASQPNTIYLFPSQLPKPLQLVVNVVIVSLFRLFQNFL